MEAFGWEVEVSRPTVRDLWRTVVGGVGPVTHFEARSGKQTVTIQVAQNEKDLLTWASIVLAVPETPRIGQVVGRKSDTWNVGRDSDSLLYTPLGFAEWRDGDAHVRRVRSLPEAAVYVPDFEGFCQDHGVAFLLHKQVCRGRSTPPLRDKLCAVVPADAYELMAALLVGQRLVPLMRGHGDGAS